MKARQLRNSILQMAIQGKLVPQDPNDEPASELLKRIREEKERLIAEGKIKKEKNPSRIFRDADNTHYEIVGNNPPVSIEDEIPFEIPESWSWVRLGVYSEKITDQVASGSFASLRANVPSLKTPDYAIMVKTADFSNGFTRNLTYTTREGYEFLENSNLFGGELILSNIGSIGKCFIVPKLDQKMTLAPNSVMIRLMEDNLRDYLYYFILSPQGFKSLTDITSGTAMKKFNKTDLKTVLIPVPPLSEQKRIVAKIEELQPFIAEYDKKETELTRLNADFPEALKKSILQEAIMGKLVPQDPNDEPASVLLDRIRDEKERLIAEGKIKRDKNESRIYKRGNSYYELRGKNEVCIDDEITFNIPNNWAWSRLSAIVSELGDGIHGTPQYDPKGDVFFINGNNLSNGKIVIKTDTKKVSKEEAVKHRRKFSSDTILTSINGTIGNIAFYNNEAVILGKSACYFNLIQGIKKEYIKILLETDYYLKYAKRVATGTTIKNVPLKGMRDFLIPVPPEPVQERIIVAYKIIGTKLTAL